MVWWLFRKKSDEDIHQKFSNLNNSLHGSFSNIKRDIDGVTKWIDHLKVKHDDHDKRFELLNFRVNNIEEFLDEMRGRLEAVQTAVQTGGLSKQAQTNTRPNSCPTVSKQLSKQDEELTLAIRLKNLTMMERAVVWVLLNTDLKLSYEDLSVALGKDKSTLRGQINNIKLKSEELVEEYPEKDGKKRFFITEKNKSEILKGLGKREELVQKVKKKAKSEG